MTTKLEQVARALCLEENKYGGTTPDDAWEDTPEHARETYLDMARAAIEAMREPTPEMTRPFLGRLGAREYGDVEAAGVWREMIDKAVE